MLVDDHPIFLGALVARLSAEPDVEVVSAARGGRQAMAALGAAAPDVVLLDAAIGEEDGLELVPAILDRLPAVKIIMLSALVQPEFIATAIRAGAVAWVPKVSTIETLIGVIRRSLHDDVYLPSGLVSAVLRSLSNRADPPASRRQGLDTLTEREWEILRCMVDGLARAQIAARLYLSPNTVRTHTQNILKKLDVHSSLEAVSVAMHSGVRPSGDG